MSKKNLNVNLNNFSKSTNLLKHYLSFRKKINKLKSKSFIVAISGGPDSLALAALTKALSQEKGKKFFYVLIDHNIRKNSDKEAIRVKKILNNHQINLRILKNKKKIIGNIQGQARKIRYELLINYCYQKKTKFILTAHNLEDQVETFLIRLSRGSGLVGLTAMKDITKLDNQIKLFRPFLDIKKEELIKITNQTFGKYIKDPSNFDNKFLRTKIRNLQKPLNDSGITHDQIIKSINNLASSRNILDNYLEKICKSNIKKTKGDVLIDLKNFNKFQSEIKMKLINESIKKLKGSYYSPRSKKVLNLISNVNKKGFKSATLAGCLFFIKNDHLCLKKERN